MPLIAPNPINDTTAGVAGAGPNYRRQTGMAAVGPGNGVNTTGRPRFATTSSGPVLIPNDWSDEEAAAYVQAWNQ